MTLGSKKCHFLFDIFWTNCSKGLNPTNTNRLRMKKKCRMKKTQYLIMFYSWGAAESLTKSNMSFSVEENMYVLHFKLVNSDQGLLDHKHNITIKGPLHPNSDVMVCNNA